MGVTLLSEQESLIYSNPNSKSRLTWAHNLLLMCFSLTYGFVLQGLPLLGFLDRQYYINYAEHSFNILKGFVAHGLLVTLANEPLWLLINIALKQLFNVETVLRLVIFLGAFSLSYFLLRANPRNSFWLMAFLLMPHLLKNNITHLRQGMAIALFYAGYFSRGAVRRWVLMASAPFVHASFFFVLPIVMLPAISKRLHLAIDVRLVIVVGFAVIASLSLGPVASMVGSRQADYYNFVMTSVSGLGFIFWAMISGLFIIQGKEFIKKNQEAVGVLIFYLISYFLIEVTARILESGMILVLLSGLALTGWRRWAFIGAFLMYSGIQWIVRLSSPTPF